MVRTWPGLDIRPLYDDPELGGSIPAVHVEGVAFAGYRQDGSDSVPVIMNVDQYGNVRKLTSLRGESWRPTSDNRGNFYFISKQAGKFNAETLHDKKPN